MFFSAFPFQIYSKMFKLGMQTSQMLVFSGEVISKRGAIIYEGISGRRPWTDPEFTKLWQEKIFANMEALNSMNKSIIKKSFSSHKGSIEKNIVDGIKAITASTLPYYKKTGSNAKRLRKKGSRF